MPEAKALPPGATVGILGGGQLGRMLALAAGRLGFRCHIYAPPGDNPAFDVAAQTTAADYGDEEALADFARSIDVATYEFENVPLATAKFIGQQVELFPPKSALEASQHRVSEKVFFRDIGVATADWLHDKDVADVVRQAAGRFETTRGIVKTCRMGYDGKGQIRVSSEEQLRDAWTQLPGDLIFEWEVPFSREVSVIAARARDGSIAAFDIVENRHENGILRTSLVPARITPAAQGQARSIAAKALEKLDYVGVVAIELFVVGDAETENLLVNEFAPRVHNSGHWTEAACATSQFEQHIRAVAGWPLGNPARHSDAEMTNLLGDEIDDWQTLGSESDSVLHIYGKRETRPGRKMGHITRLKPLSDR